MTMMWTAAALLTVATLLAVLFPLLRGRGIKVEKRSEYDLAVYRDQLTEIDRDRERGLLDETQADAARVEIQRRMLDAADGQDMNAGVAEADSAKRVRDLGLALILTLLVGGGAVALYLDLGRPGMPDLPLAGRELDSERQAQQAAEMGDLVEKLYARLKESPDDLRGWLLLGRSLESMERFKEAAEAYRHTIELSDRNPGALGAYADALVQDAGDHIPDAVVPILEELQGKDPTDPRPYFYLGARKANTGDLKGALQEWVNLETVSPPEAPWMGDLRARIQAAAKNLGVDPADVKPTVEAPPPQAASAGGDASGSGAAPGPSAADVEAAQAMTEEERMDMIRGMVEQLAERLENNPDDREGWLRLAKAYEVLGEHDKAARARIRAETAGK